MKKQYLAVAVFSLGVQTAWAQSSVTLYGLVDVAVRFATNQSSGSGAANRLYMTDGATTGSRWGLKGSEDLGGGASAIFLLESGYSLTTGAFGQQGQLFGRQAYVGVSNAGYGTLKFGRQYGTAFDYLVNFDPVTVGNVNPDDWEAFLLGIRFDNTVAYSNNLGPISVEIQRSFGNQAGGLSEGSTTAVDAIYRAGGLKVGLLAQQSKDAKGHSLLGGSAGVTYAFGQAVFDTYYIQARRDAGFSVSASNSGLPLANTSLFSNVNTVAGTGTQTAARADHLALIGGTYLATPYLKFTLAGLYDWTSNVAPGKNGETGSVYGIADYLLSKRTDIYLETDYSHLSGASVTDPNSPIGTFSGKSSSIGAMVGVRTRF